ncbi:MAG TPA: class I SAM-dependent methyltransferase [Myxococcota bacterium]|nr:class I SAM-dependent methyltransferase [Myxococcota bacterium]
MREGRPSTTAFLVAAGRAVADGVKSVEGFSDPVARALLPPSYQRAVDLVVSGRPASGLLARRRVALVRRMQRMAPARTVAIDAALRAAPARAQVVLLGAGLDARAWRMPELAGSLVFEVDHPSTQGWKRERTAELQPTAREVRFVAIDFQRETLEDVLARAGHDASVPTLWIWEGVIRYLTREAIEHTLESVARRSAPGSRLLVTHGTREREHRWLHKLMLRVLGEPVRSRLDGADLAALLAPRGFAVLSDDAWGGRAREGASRHLLVAERR